MTGLKNEAGIQKEIEYAFFYFEASLFCYKFEQSEKNMSQILATVDELLRVQDHITILGFKKIFQSIKMGGIKIDYQPLTDYISNFINKNYTKLPNDVRLNIPIVAEFVMIDTQKIQKLVEDNHELNASENDVGYVSQSSAQLYLSGVMKAEGKNFSDKTKAAIRQMIIASNDRGYKSITDFLVTNHIDYHVFPEAW